MAAAGKQDSARARLAELTARLSELEATLDAIRTGAVDALVVSGPEGEQVFTLKGADEAYRVLVEAMNEGAVTVGSDGTILYANRRFASLLKMPLQKVLGVPLSSFIALRERSRFADFLERSVKKNAITETTLLADDGSELTVHLSGNPLPTMGVEGICLVVTDITQRKEIERAQRELSKNLLDAQEKERQRVARELHDGVNQLLSSTKHRLHNVEAKLAGQTTLRRNVAEVRRLLDRTMGEIRAISRNLRPSELDDLGLVAAIRTLGDEFARRTQTQVNFRFQELAHAITAHVELTVYRVFQEALSNVEKHAKATKVRVRLSITSSRVRLYVTDNGRGFTERGGNGHWGLINMRERASYVNGTLEVRSQRDKGTEIELNVPL